MQWRGGSEAAADIGDSMNRVQFLDLGGQPRGMNIANIYRGELFASYFLDGIWQYVKLEREDS